MNQKKREKKIEANAITHTVLYNQFARIVFDGNKYITFKTNALKAQQKKKNILMYK